MKKYAPEKQTVLHVSILREGRNKIYSTTSFYSSRRYVYLDDKGPFIYQSGKDHKIIFSPMLDAWVHIATAVRISAVNISAAILSQEKPA